MQAIEEDNLTPPEGDRVAARALVLAAVSCRGLIENEREADPQGAENLRQRFLPWLDSIGASGELEPTEAVLLSTPVGELDRQATIDATWRSEGLVVLAWALQYAGLPSLYVLCAPEGIFNSMGFLQRREQTPLAAPCLRNAEDLHYWADTYLTLHWRLRQFSLQPGPMDFVAFAAACKWATMRLNELEVKDKDLAINGVRIDSVDGSTMQDIVSITQERRIALDWLLGFEPLYSQVTTDT